MTSYRPIGIVVAVVLVMASSRVWADDGEGSIVHGGLYLDFAYLYSENQPANYTWRSKGTSSVLDKIKVDNATIFLERDATADFRWGFSAGLQWGVDPDAGVPSSNARSKADDLSHLYYTYLKYLLDIGNGLALTAGLIPGHLGYADFHAIHNPCYTRMYGVDYVPYFNFGARADYTFGERFVGSFLVLDGWNYLERSNDAPSFGLQTVAGAGEELETTFNLYYGPDQPQTSLKFWRSVVEGIVEWQEGSFLFAARAGYGSQQEAAVAGNPRFEWAYGALWLQWRGHDPWRFALRPEFFWDPDGLQTGFRQTIRAVTATFEYRLSRRDDVRLLSVRFEYRYDRSTGDQGGFYEGSTNGLVPGQNLIIASLLWRFDSANLHPDREVPDD